MGLKLKNTLEIHEHRIIIIHFLVQLKKKSPAKPGIA